MDIREFVARTYRYKKQETPEVLQRATIWSFDPGVHTGIAMVTGLFFAESCTVHSLDELKLFLGHKLLGGHNASPFQTCNPQFVVCENFQVQGRSQYILGTDNPSSRTIGFLYGLCTSRGIPFVLQQPGSGRRLITRDVCRTLEVELKTEHELSAFQHLMYFLLFAKPNVLKGELK